MILGRRFGRRNAASLLTFPQIFVVCVLVFLGGSSSSSQTRPSSPIDTAARALALGKFDEVDSLLRTATDPRSIALRARAEAERGRYAEAEKLLTPAAAAAPDSDAALELGLLQMRLGRRESATRILQAVVDRTQASRPADLLRLALASRALGEFQEANGYFRQASMMAPDDAVINTAWGDLFLEKYNRGEALKSYQAALKVDADFLPAQIGLARVALDENPPAAHAAVEKALKANAGYVPALLLSAEMSLDERKRADARASIRRALEVNPNGLEARSLEAAIAFLEGRNADFMAQVQEALKINPRYGEIYRVAGDHAARNYLFTEAVDLTQRSLMLDRDNSRAHAELGMHLLRTGDEPGARVQLEAAFKADPYNAVTFNNLSLLDTLDKFVTIREGDIVLRLHADEAPVMREHAMPLAKQALETLSKRWDFKPAGPILVEMFPKHDDFAVRTIGLPGFIGALGACFGKVVTLDSPKARPPGEFNWGTTLWHEMAHVITLQMSNNRLPRWLSEGISVWEERRARPEWGRETEVQFAAALTQGKTLKLADLNEGFSNPQLINITYYQASLVVDHLVATYGEPALRQFLRAYGRGLETDAALQEAYKVTMEQLQTSFDAAVDRQFGALRRALKTPEIPEDATVDQLKALAAANAESFVVHMRLGVAQRKAGDAVGAIKTLERAAQLVPSATGKDNPNVMIAAIALERNDNARAIQALEAVLKVDHSDVESARKLASLVAPLGDAARTNDAYQRLVAIDPFDAPAEAALGRLALQRRDAESAVRAFRVVLATQPADKAAAHVDLAEAYVMAGQLADAKKQALSALEIAPSFERAQDILLKIVDGPSGQSGGRQ
jgi:cellulose synthase operon protein C